MAKQKKRRKVSGNTRTWTYGDTSGGILDCLVQQTVKMRIRPSGYGWPAYFSWQAYLGKRWMQDERECTGEGGAQQSGNAWAKRMNLTPEWE